MAKKIKFSQKALDSLSNSNRLHVLTSVKASWSWLLLVSITVLLAAVVFWGCFGRIAESVTCSGITLLSEGVKPVIAQGDGTLKYLNIDAGAKVRTGQVLGQIYNPEIVTKVRKLRSEYETLKNEISFLKEGNNRLINYQLSLEKQKKENLKNIAKEQQLSRERQKELLESYSSLLGKGVVSKLEYYRTLDQLVQTENSQLSLLLQSLASDSEVNNLIWQGKEKLLELNQRLEEKYREYTLTKKLFSESFWLSSDSDGTIIEIFKEQGAFVQSGEKIALVASSPNDGIYLVAYVPLENGKKIKTGMRGFFSPSNAPAAKYGYVKCVVREVSSTPVNYETITAELLNSSLAQRIAGKDVMTRVVLELIPNAHSLSGYSWTGKNDYNTKIINGVFGQLVINTEYRSPISYIIPALRELFTSKPTNETEGK
jgi:HlyD family secretion protein